MKKQEQVISETTNHPINSTWEATNARLHKKYGSPPLRTHSLKTFTKCLKTGVLNTLTMRHNTDTAYPDHAEELLLCSILNITSLALVLWFWGENNKDNTFDSVLLYAFGTVSFGSFLLYLLVRWICSTVVPLQHVFASFSFSLLPLTLFTPLLANALTSMPWFGFLVRLAMLLWSSWGLGNVLLTNSKAQEKRFLLVLPVFLFHIFLLSLRTTLCY